MKRLILSLAVAAAALAGFTATADAGQTVRYLAGYDHCGRPVYAVRYIQTYNYRPSYCRPSYSRSYRHTPSYRHYSHGYSARSHYGSSYGRSYGRSYSSYGRGYCR